jgi:hypothetical protein
MHHQSVDATCDTGAVATGDVFVESTAPMLVFAITDHSGNRRTDIAILAIEVRAESFLSIASNS